MLLEQQVSGMESLGITITDEVYDQVAGSLEYATYLVPVSTIVCFCSAHSIFRVTIGSR